MKVLSEPHPDTTSEENWTAVDVAPAWGLKSPVSLSRIKAEPSLRNMPLVRLGRLSVIRLTRRSSIRLLLWAMASRSCNMIVG